MRVKSSGVRSLLMGRLAGNCRSHHEVLVGDRGKMLALDVDDDGTWRSWDVKLGGSRIGLGRQLSVVFQDRG